MKSCINCKHWQGTTEEVAECGWITMSGEQDRLSAGVSTRHDFACSAFTPKDNAEELKPMIDDGKRDFVDDKIDEIVGELSDVEVTMINGQYCISNCGGAVIGYPSKSNALAWLKGFKECEDAFSGKYRPPAEELVIITSAEDYGSIANNDLRHVQIPRDNEVTNGDVLQITAHDGKQFLPVVRKRITGLSQMASIDPIDVADSRTYGVDDMRVIQKALQMAAESDDEDLSHLAYMLHEPDYLVLTHQRDQTDPHKGAPDKAEARAAWREQQQAERQADEVRRVAREEARKARVIDLIDMVVNGLVAEAMAGDPQFSDSDVENVEKIERIGYSNTPGDGTRLKPYYSALFVPDGITVTWVWNSDGSTAHLYRHDGQAWDYAPASEYSPVKNDK